MRKISVYVDTSVIGGCFDQEFETWSKGLMQDFEENRFVPVLSEIVATEIGNAPEQVQDQFKQILQLSHVFLELTDEAVDLAKLYLERKIISPKYFEDSLHIALATINDINILVSWNFKHIVHFDKIRQFNSVNVENGYKDIDIFSPMEVTTHGKF